MTARLPVERRVRERREPYVPIYRGLLLKHRLGDGAVGLFVRILDAAYSRRGEVALPRAFSDVCALHDAIGGNLRSMRRDLPELVAAGLVAFGESRSQRVLEVPSWERYRSRPSPVEVDVCDGPSVPLDDAPRTPRERAENAPRTPHKKETSNTEDLPDPSTYKEEEKEEEEEERGRESEPPLPAEVDEPEESGTFLRVADVARAETPDPDVADPVVVLPLRHSTAHAWVDLNLVPAVAEAFRAATGAPWCASPKDRAALLRLLGPDLFARSLTGLRVSELRARFARAVTSVVAAERSKRNAGRSNVTGWPLWLLEQWLADGGDNARTLTEAPRPRPTLAKVPRTLSADEEPASLEFVRDLVAKNQWLWGKGSTGSRA